VRPLALIAVILSACRSAPQPKPTASKQEHTAPTQRRILVASDLTHRLIRQPRPVYPNDAKKARIQCVVRLNIVIAKTGEVTDIHVVFGHPALVAAAIEAVKHWQYAPTYLNGEPVELKTTVDLNFTLNQKSNRSARILNRRAARVASHENTLNASGYRTVPLIPLSAPGTSSSAIHAATAPEYGLRSGFASSAENPNRG